jgi:LemA protein
LKIFTGAAIVGGTAIGGGLIAMRTLKVWFVLAGALLASGCGYNRIQQQDEGVKAAWSEVVNQYQRRADLVPNLVNTVKGFAAQEQKVLIGVTEARAKVGTIQATPELVNDPQAFQKFEAAQGQLSQALKSLIAVSENYPQLKSDQNFRDLQAQLEGTENRIAVARMRYIQAVQDYNVLVRSFPTNLTAMIFKYPTKQNFTVQNEAEIARPPTVDFGSGAPAPPPTGAR